MRNLLIIIPLVCAGGYFVYTHPAMFRPPSGAVALPDAMAWKFVTHIDSEWNRSVAVVLMRGSAWRMEWKNTASRKISTAVCDGSRFVSADPRAAALAPRPTMTRMWADLGKPVGTEARGGVSYWHFIHRYNGHPEDAWIDSQTHFPVYREWTNPAGKHYDVHYAVLEIDLAAPNLEYFDTKATAPMLSQYLTP